MVCPVRGGMNVYSECLLTPVKKTQSKHFNLSNGQHCWSHSCFSYNNNCDDSWWTTL